MYIDEVNHLSSLSSEAVAYRSKLANSLYVAFMHSRTPEEGTEAESARLSFKFADAFIARDLWEKERIDQAQAAKLKGIENLFQWVKKHGSDDLKRKTAWGSHLNCHAAWQQIAVDEFVAFHAPEGFFAHSDNHEYVLERKSPRENETETFNALKELQKAEPLTFSNIKLVAHNSKNAKGNFYCTKSRIMLTLTTPNYESFTLAKETSQQLLPW